jgi:hypothetical protein
MLIIFPVRWLPYIFALGGLAVGLMSLPTLLEKSEEKPTAVTLHQLQGKSPDERWLRVTGGGLYMRDILWGGTTHTDKNTHAETRTTTEYYVPLLSRTQAFERGQSRTGAFPPNQRLVLVRFTANDFMKKFPTPASRTGNNAFRETPIEGVRAYRAVLPADLYAIINNDYRLPIENVTVIDADETPAKKSDAALVMVCGLAISASAAGWLKMRMM